MRGPFEALHNNRYVHQMYCGWPANSDVIIARDPNETVPEYAESAASDGTQECLSGR